MKFENQGFNFQSITLFLVLVSSLLFCGCGNHNSAHREAPNVSSLAVTAGSSDSRTELPADIKTEIIQEKRKPDSTLAYTHDIQVEVSRSNLIAQLEIIKSACINDKEESCTILNINSSNDAYMPNGYISMRLAPNKVDGIVSLAGQHGKIISQSTSAEDLAPQLTDTAQRLATLNTFRERLNGFMVRRDMPAQQLITIARELSDTQTQIESMSRTRTELKHRIDTDLLNIRFSIPPEEYSERQTPIKNSIRSFGEHFSLAISGVIDFFAYMLPWIPVILLILFGMRTLWRFLKKKPSTQPST